MKIAETWRIGRIIHLVPIANPPGDADISATGQAPTNRLCYLPRSCRPPQAGGILFPGILQKAKSHGAQNCKP